MSLVICFNCCVIPLKLKVIPEEFPVGKPLPATVISRLFVPELKAGVIDVIVEIGVANVNLQLSEGHVASDEAAWITTTSWFGDPTKRPVFRILQVS